MGGNGRKSLITIGCRRTRLLLRSTSVRASIPTDSPLLKQSAVFQGAVYGEKRLIYE
jgi:hypothetical protein